MRNAEYLCGQDYVRNAIQKSGLSVIPRLENECDNCFDFGDFERGMVEELRKYKQAGAEYD